MSIFTAVNPVTSGNFTRKSDYDAIFENTLALKQGDQALDFLRLNAQSDSLGSATYNNYALGATTGILRLEPATVNADITGLTGPVAGRTLIIQNLGNAYVRLVNDSGSVANQRFSTASANGQFLGKNGCAYVWYDSVTSRWVVVPISPGLPITPTFNAADYSGVAPLGWTVAGGNVVKCSFQQMGRVLKVWLLLDSTTTTGSAGSTLRRVLPAGFSSGVFQYSPMFRIKNNSVEDMGFASINVSFIEIFRAGLANWAVAASSVSIYCPPFDIEVS